MSCNGHIYCEINNTASVTVTTNNTSEIFQIENAPICVEVNKVTVRSDNSINKKCWHFWGTRNNEPMFDHFACGDTANYQTSSKLANNGAWLIVDGVRQNNEDYYYWSGVVGEDVHRRHLEQVTEVKPLSGQVTGSCAACLSTKIAWTMTIKDKNYNLVYQKTFNEEPRINVGCNGCPAGSLKCKCEAYPGYCCIPCNEIKSGISSAREMLRRINNG